VPDWKLDRQSGLSAGWRWSGFRHLRNLFNTHSDILGGRALFAQGKLDFVDRTHHVAGTLLDLVDGVAGPTRQFLSLVGGVSPQPHCLHGAAVPLWMRWIMSPICWVEAEVRSASFLTSSATTAKPRPCSPARAASMAAFRASRLV